ncbi:MAG TPA: T9SS type A sorting domain-containing protein, partial [Ignavibacteria bacterium]
NNRILKTLNGGVNWISQYLDPSPSGRATNISAVNSDKIWCGRSQNYIMASNESGTNWGKQTSQITDNSGLYMYDTLLGFAWSYQVVRTTNGGGPITNIEKISNKIPNNYNLKQNYPNPFNSTTIIEFDIPKFSIIQLKLYDILGKEVINIFDPKELNSGNYKVKLNFDNYYLSSGNYFYKLTGVEKESGKNFQLIKKLIYIK